MPRQFVIALFASLLAVTGSTVVRADETGPTKDVPELQVLQHYAGTWDVELTGNGSGKGEVTAKWILGGRFLEQAGVMHSPDGPGIGVTTLFTFDTQAGKYRSWMFLSNGSTNQAEMTWDANAPRRLDRRVPREDRRRPLRVSRAVPGLRQAQFRNR